MKTFKSVWDAIEDTKQEASQMKLRSSLMFAINDHINNSGWSKSQAVKMIGVDELYMDVIEGERINDIDLNVLKIICRNIGIVADE